MNVKILFAALLALCGAAFASSVHAGDYFCRVYSGTDTWEKAPPYKGKEGHYKFTAADPAAAAAAAVAKAQANHTAKLTNARCETSIAAFDTAAAAGTAAPPSPVPAASQPAHGDTQWYCMAFSADGNRLPAPATAAAGETEGNYYTLKGGTGSVAAQAKVDDDALALARKYHPTADSVMCDLSIRSLEAQ